MFIKKQKAFLENLAKNSSGGSNGIIGQFGVGFYSAFMVADKVEVYSQSYKPGEKAFEWNSTGFIYSFTKTFL